MFRSESLYKKRQQIQQEKYLYCKFKFGTNFLVLTQKNPTWLLKQKKVKCLSARLVKKKKKN